MNNLEIQTLRTGVVSQLTLVGEATIYDAAELKDLLVHELDGALQLELDLERIQEIDTAGLQVLLLLQRECQAHCKTLHLVRPSQPVQDLISLFGLNACFPPAPLETAKEEGQP